MKYLYQLPMIILIDIISQSYFSLTNNKTLFFILLSIWSLANTEVFIPSPAQRARIERLMDT